MKRLLLVAGVAVLAACPNAAAAADFALMVGEPQTLQNAATGDRIVVTVEANRSYCCSVRSVALADMARLGEAVNVTTGQVDNTFPRSSFNGNVAPVIPVSSMHPLPAFTRHCFVPASDGAYALPLELTVSPSAATNAVCEETTLVAGFNLVATDFAFLEVSVLTSPRDSNNAVWYRAFSSAEEEIVGEFLGFSRFDHPIHEFASPGTYATLFLVHTGPPGSISAQVSQYAVESVTPFVFRPLTQALLRKRADL